MTSLVCWVGRDHRKHNSIYIASDSRLTADKVVVSDSAQKVFACRSRPEIYGYCGNAGLPPAMLAELVRDLDGGRAWHLETDATRSAGLVVERLSRCLPVQESGPDYSVTVIVRGLRAGEGYLNAVFAVQRFFVRDEHWDWFPEALPDESDVVVAEGSGASRVRAWREHWSSAQGRRRTSRAVFSALCDALKAGEDPASGGAPQLVGMYQEGWPEVFGVLYQGARYVLGQPAPANTAARWHDDLFQVCDAETMAPKPGAQRHLAPRGLGKDTSCT
jgi:hypothetical protein